MGETGREDHKEMANKKLDFENPPKEGKAMGGGNGAREVGGKKLPQALTKEATRIGAARSIQAQKASKGREAPGGKGGGNGNGQNQKASSKHKNPTKDWKKG